MPPTLREILVKFACGPQVPSFLAILGSLFACPKLIEKRHTLKASQNPKNLAQGAPKLDFGAFGEPFWHTFSMVFHSLYEKNEKRADTVIPQ